MPPAHRQGDIGSGHGCHFPESAATGGSPNVFVNGKPLMRVGDAYEPHACTEGHEGPHGRVLSKGSASVFVNGMPAGRIGDAVDCGGTAAAGSPNVFIGDEAPAARGSSAPACPAQMAKTSSPFSKG